MNYLCSQQLVPTNVVHVLFSISKGTEEELAKSQNNINIEQRRRFNLHTLRSPRRQVCCKYTFYDYYWWIKWSLRHKKREIIREKSRNLAALNVNTKCYNNYCMGLSPYTWACHL